MCPGEFVLQEVIIQIVINQMSFFPLTLRKDKVELVTAFIYSFHRCLLNTYYRQGNVLGTLEQEYEEKILEGTLNLLEELKLMTGNCRCIYYDLLCDGHALLPILNSISVSIGLTHSSCSFPPAFSITLFPFHFFSKTNTQMIPLLVFISEFAYLILDIS